MKPEETMTQPHPINPVPMVCGFAFRTYRDHPMHAEHVALVRKAKPAWMRGLLNGVGGKIEPGEDALTAMRREWQEETQLAVPDWSHFLDLTGTWGTVHFFRAQVAWDAGEPVGEADEPVHWYPVPDIFQVRGGASRLVPNLRWLLPLALDSQCHGIITVDSAE